MINTDALFVELYTNSERILSNIVYFDFCTLLRKATPSPFVLYHKDFDLEYNNKNISQSTGPFFIVKALNIV